LLDRDGDLVVLELDEEAGEHGIYVLYRRAGWNSASTAPSVTSRPSRPSRSSKPRPRSASRTEACAPTMRTLAPRVVHSSLLARSVLALCRSTPGAFDRSSTRSRGRAVSPRKRSAIASHT